MAGEKSSYGMRAAIASHMTGKMHVTVVHLRFVMPSQSGGVQKKADM